MRIAHYPVGQVLHKLIAKLHFLPKQQVLAPPHHHLHQLTHLRLHLNDMHRRVQVTHVLDQIYHQRLDAHVAERIVSGIGRRVFTLQDALHDKNDVLNKQSVLFTDADLACGVEELFHDDLDLLEENRVAEGAELVAE